MRKGRAWTIALMLVLALSGCGAEEKTDAVQPEHMSTGEETGAAAADAQTDESNAETEREPEAETLPESCRRWYDTRETGGAAERLGDVPLAARAEEGVSNEFGYSFWTPDGQNAELALNAAQEGVTLEEFSGGGAKQSSSYGQIVWNGEAYHALTIDAADCAIPNLRPNGRSLLRLNITGICTVDGGGEELGCFAGFDCVLLTGSGELRIQNSAGLTPGGGDLPLPGLIVDGEVTLTGGIVAPQPNEGGALALAQLGGTVKTEMLRGNGGELLLAGGTLLARDVREFTDLTFRDGTALLDWLEGAELTLVLSGGACYLAGPLPEGTTVESGAGVLAAQDVSAADIRGDAERALGGEAAVSRYFQTTYSEDWLNTADRSGMIWEPLTLTTAGGGWFAGTLSMEDAAADELLPWGALWLRLAGENTVSGDVGGTGLLIEGEGSLSVGALNLWGWGGIHHPTFTQRGSSVTTGGFSMGCNSGETAAFEVSGGSFTCTGETWMQNAALVISGGEVRFAQPCNLDGGSVTVTGGTVYLEQGLWLGSGDITVTGGEVVVRGGMDGLIAEHGTVYVTGGTVREP